MRTLLAVATLAVGIAVYSALPAAAQDKTDRQAAGGLVAKIQDLNLTDEQETKIADISKEFKPKVQDAAKDLNAIVKEEMEKVRAVLNDEQRTKLAAMKDERQERRVERLSERFAHLAELDLTGSEMAKIAELRKEYHPKIAAALESLKGSLSVEQRKARMEAFDAGKTCQQIVAALNLTDDQKQKIESVGKEVRGLVREEMEKIRDILTDEQKEKLQEFKDEHVDHVRDRMAHRVANYEELKLTDDQKTQIADIRKEYRPKVHEAGNKLRATVREEMEAVLAVIKG
jgi:Spy/CpxP family protein refolding chaperone